MRACRSRVGGVLAEVPDSSCLVLSVPIQGVLQRYGVRVAVSRTVVQDENHLLLGSDRDDDGFDTVLVCQVRPTGNGNKGLSTSRRVSWIDRRA